MVYDNILVILICSATGSSEYNHCQRGKGRGENSLQNVEYGMRNSTTYTLRNYKCVMFGFLLAVETIVNVATRLFSK